jgi:hypothetical protein
MTHVKQMRRFGKTTSSCDEIKEGVFVFKGTAIIGVAKSKIYTKQAKHAL